MKLKNVKLRWVTDFVFPGLWPQYSYVPGLILISSAIDDLSTAGRVIVERTMNTAAKTMHNDGMIKASFCLQVELDIKDELIWTFVHLLK